MTNGILIEPLVNNKVHGVAIQEKSFSFGLRITNQQETPSNEFNISKIKLSSAEDLKVEEDLKNLFMSVN